MKQVDGVNGNVAKIVTLVDFTLLSPIVLHEEPTIIHFSGHGTDSHV